MGAFLAAANGLFDGLITALCLLTAVLLQILSNLANDYGDSVHGADAAGRQGPMRAVHGGFVTPQQMKLAIGGTAVLSVVSGFSLIWLAFGREALVWVILFALLGGLAILAAITYTAGSKPYGYAGLGDVAVLIFFGWVAVLGTYFLQAQTLDWTLLLPATSVGLLAVGVLNVNNIRDLASDRKAGKRSLPVRLGPQRARVYHGILLATAVLLALFYVLVHYGSPWQFLFLLSVPLLARNGLGVWRAQTPRQVAPFLKQMALATLLFVLTFGLGLVLT